MAIASNLTQRTKHFYTAHLFSSARYAASQLPLFIYPLKFKKADFLTKLLKRLAQYVNAVNTWTRPLVSAP